MTKLNPRSVQFKAKPHNFRFAHGNERSDNRDVALFRPGPDDPVEGLIVRGAAVGIAGAVRFDGADIDFRGPSTSAQLTATDKKCALRKGT